jgi:hypothetical protein
LATYRWILERQGVDPTTRVTGRITNVGARDDELTLAPETDVGTLIRERFRRLGPDE